MKLTKIIAALSLISAVLPVAAMQRMTDFELSHVSGREGVSILANLTVQIGAFTSFSLIGQAFFKLNQLLISEKVATGDVISAPLYVAALTDSLRAYGIKEADMTSIVASLGDSRGALLGTDVVQMTFPALPSSAMDGGLNISVASTHTGFTGASMGGLVLKDINPAGTKIWFLGQGR